MKLPLELPLIEDAELTAKVKHRWDQLTKPPGSLGRLEEVVLRLALIQGSFMPVLGRQGMYVFCGDHGVVEEGVSAYPSEVTAQMVRNFLAGGAAINVLCRWQSIQPVVVDAGVKGPLQEGVVDCRVAPGTRNFAVTSAMTAAQAEAALQNGMRLAGEARESFDIVGVGDMGIGNTTAASALLCAFGGVSPEDAAGRGAGLDDEGVRRKARVIARALDLHKPGPADPVAALAAVGGLEIAAMAGFLLGAAKARLPVVVDGFIACSAVLVAKAMAPRLNDFVFYSHRSAERAHAKMLEFLGAAPLLDLNLRLGEGTGAVFGMAVLEAALACYREMATFETAMVTQGRLRYGASVSRREGDQGSGLHSPVGSGQPNRW
jgi:nicotinate-nucleotide--dimethylbenzimidazole phosphoribosyltransferase